MKRKFGAKDGNRVSDGSGFDFGMDNSEAKKVSSSKQKLLTDLRKKLANIETAEKALCEEMKYAARAHSEAMNAVREIKEDIKSLEKSMVGITDHAVLRYLERVKGLDVAEIKKQILDENMEMIIEKMGNGKYPVCNGVKAVVKDKTVVTVIAK
ncbi:hypothetical protein [Aliikangiella coralliicola]|uniref:Uncharacterized protein n=1 Tax=Aliikangiella coralliicola TaxID=2592383 RepID=A0A545U048_9GAMM|nr:hypothetical protein [Aliikangiella coralliicola]TQV82837.1 hypothetical protein FLL46_24010 [Aliikangiella coralliicola]